MKWGLNHRAESRYARYNKQGAKRGVSVIAKDTQPAKDRSRGKIIFAGVVFALILAGLWARAYHVQIVKGPEYAKMANRQYWASEIVSGKRGEIFDRNGLLLATTISTQSVYIRPHEIKDKAGVSRQLSSILGINLKTVSALVGSDKRFVWVARKIGDAQAIAVREAMLPGVYLDVENSRQYPQAHLRKVLTIFCNLPLPNTLYKKMLRASICPCPAKMIRKILTVKMFL